MDNQVTKEKIQFLSEGLLLTGHLYKPAGFSLSQQYPAIVAGGSLTSVKEQMREFMQGSSRRRGLLHSLLISGTMEKVKDSPASMKIRPTS